MGNKKLSREEIEKQISQHEIELAIQNRLANYIRSEKERLEEQLVTTKHQIVKLNQSLSAYQKQLLETAEKETKTEKQ